MAADRPQAYRFDDDGAIPNSELPVLIYRGVDDVAGGAPSCEELFDRNGWWRFWRDGIYPFHHFHSTAHEALGVVSGQAPVILGGPVNGDRFELEAGDVAILPAGTGHCNAGSSGDFLVVGAYRAGRTGTCGAAIRPSTTRRSRTSSACRCRRPIRCTDPRARCLTCGRPGPRPPGVSR